MPDEFSIKYDFMEENKVLRCQNCGVSLHETTNFCTSCGTSVVFHKDENAPIGQQTPTNERRAKAKFSIKSLSRNQKIITSSVFLVLIIIAVLAILGVFDNKSLTKIWYEAATEDFKRFDYKTLALTKVEKAEDSNMADYRYNDDNNLIVYCSYSVFDDEIVVRVLADARGDESYRLDEYGAIRFYLLKDGKVVDLYGELGGLDAGRNIKNDEDDPSFYAYDYSFEFDGSDNTVHEYTVEIFNFAEQIKYIYNFLY